MREDPREDTRCDRVRQSILGVPIDNITMSESVRHVKALIEKGKRAYIVTPNAEMVIRAHDDPELLRIIKGADLVIPDGAGLLMASRLLGCPFRERVAGIDLMAKLFRLSGEEGYRVYLLGARPDVVEKCAVRLQREFGVCVAGYCHGYFTEDEEVINLIESSYPDIVFVALGSPRQEIWIERNYDRLCEAVYMGVGGSLDVFAGYLKRAPAWMQSAGFEWLYRLLQEPKRLNRSLLLLRFLLEVLKKPFAGRHGDC